MSKVRVMLMEGIRAGGIMAAGDMLAQTALEKRSVKEVDVARVVRFGAIGLFFVGPSLRLWYSALDRMIAPGHQAAPLKRAVKKMCVDQFLFAPIFTLAITGVVGTVNGETPQRIRERIRNDYLTIMMTNYMLWPAAQVVNFSLVPVQYQVVFAQIVAVAWNCFLSMKLNSTA